MRTNEHKSWSMMNIGKVREAIEIILVPIDDIAVGIGDFNPDLRVDTRLRERLLAFVNIMNNKFGSFKLPVTSCYRPFSPQLGSYHELDAKDPRGHWTGLAIDINYRAVLNNDIDRIFFIKSADKCGLKRIWLVKYDEWWHFSDYEWRPDSEVARMRWEVLKEVGLV